LIATNLANIQSRIRRLEKSRPVGLIAVSKTKPITDLQAAIDAGQRHFGENYVQEASLKIEALKAQNKPLIWHFIGPIQSNKTTKIAQHFDWVHSIDRLKIAQRLNNQRPKNLPKLNILLQINIDAEPSKSGFLIEEIEEILPSFEGFSRLSLRGFMCIPKANNSGSGFEKMAKLFKQYPNFDTLSMGMSQDFELAIKNGATFIRIGSDIFGKRA
jgi:pyridoxal phosphate enzyme (YggS family)